MSFTDFVHATKTALSLDPAQAQAKFEAHPDLVGPCEVTVKVASGSANPRRWRRQCGCESRGACPLAALGS